MNRKEELTLSKAEARRFLLSHQGLNRPEAAAGEGAILDHFRRVGCIQFDPLDKAGRNADLVLQARFPDYTPGHLESLLYRERRLLDGMDKVMSIYRMEDWPYFRRRREEGRRWLCESRRGKPIAAVREEVLREIREKGPLSSKELSLTGQVDWSWAPTTLARAALEGLYHTGDLVIHHKKGTRKFYDLAERTIPSGLFEAAEPHPSLEEYRRWYVKRRLGSVGLLANRGADPWLGTFKTPERAAALEELLEAGEIRRMAVEGISHPFYARTSDLERSPSRQPRITFLAPLDNLLWDRRMIEELFGFRYRWEVYKPAKLREYGYYVLPVLRGDEFIARFEPVRNRKTGGVTVKNWWWESGVRVTAQLRAEAEEALERFARFLGGEGVEWHYSRG